MAIFNSYVKLPEGTMFATHLGPGVWTGDWTNKGCRFDKDGDTANNFFWLQQTDTGIRPTNRDVFASNNRHGYGSIPIDTIFRGMNIHLPAILGFTRYQGFDPSPHGFPRLEPCIWWCDCVCVNLTEKINGDFDMLDPTGGWWRGNSCFPDTFLPANLSWHLG